MKELVYYLGEIRDAAGERDDMYYVGFDWGALEAIEQIAEISSKQRAKRLAVYAVYRDTVRDNTVAVLLVDGLLDGDGRFFPRLVNAEIQSPEWDQLRKRLTAKQQTRESYNDSL